MKKLSHYIDRPQNILTGNMNLEPLSTFKDFPVFMGCVDSSSDEDVLADMEWGIDPETGVIQLQKLLPLELLYQDQHNDGTGKVWQDHYRLFAKFLLKHAEGGPILEIGGAHDVIASAYLTERPEDTWIIVEPNPQHINNPSIHVIQDWFDETFSLDTVPQTVVHSHVFEHVYDPKLFIEHIYAILPVGGRCIFTLPNMEAMLAKKFTNCLNFEHTDFLTEPIVDWLVAQAGFHLVAKEYFGDPHSIFYAVEKRKEKTVSSTLPKKYEDYRKLFLEFVKYHEDIVQELNNRIVDSAEPVYIFGAHIFSQYLIQFGLTTEKIVSVLDNSELKQGKRLYGTELCVESPKVLAKKGRVNVILKAGIYNEEIKNDILTNINPDIVFW